MTRFKSKTTATILATLGGSLGLHRFYLDGARSYKPWCYPVYFGAIGLFGLRAVMRQRPDWVDDWTQLLHPLVLVALLPTLVGMIEALVFALTPDVRWDHRWNRHSLRSSHSGALVIIIAILTAAASATLLMSIIAISVETIVDVGAQRPR